MAARSNSGGDSMKPTTVSTGRRIRTTERDKQKARQRVVERGLVQFRAPEELVDQLMQLAEHKKIPVSVLVRSWVAEHVAAEMPQVPLKQLQLPNGNVLTKDSYANELEAALSKYESGKLKLTAREKCTLKIWLFDQNVEAPEKKRQLRKS